MNKFLFAILAIPLLTFAASEKPKLTKPTITHGPKSAVENKLDAFQFCLTDERRIEFLNDFFKFQKPELTKPELQVLCKILHELNAKNDPIVPKLVISQTWRAVLTSFNEVMLKLFDAIDQAQPKVAASATEPENKWLAVIKDVSERYAKDSSVDCISRADVEDAFNASKPMTALETIGAAILLEENGTLSDPVTLQFAYCLLARQYSHAGNMGSWPSKNGLQLIIPQKFNAEARRFFFGLYREPYQNLLTHYKTQRQLLECVLLHQFDPNIARIIVKYATNFGISNAASVEIGDGNAARVDSYTTANTDWHSTLNSIMDIGRNKRIIIRADDGLITDINPPESYVGPVENITHIHLNENDIAVIPANAFTAFTGLLILNLSSNCIATIAEDAFPKSLTRLRLNDNRLSETEKQKIRTWWKATHETEDGLYL